LWCHVKRAGGVSSGVRAGAKQIILELVVRQIRFVI